MTSTVIALLLLLLPNVEAPIHQIDNLSFIEVEVNGKPASFLIDSGSPVTILDSRQAKTFGFKAVGPERSVTGLCNTHSWRAASEAIFHIEGQRFFPILATADLICFQQRLTQTLPAPLLGIIGNDILNPDTEEDDQKDSGMAFFFNQNQQTNLSLHSENHSLFGSMRR